MSYEFEGFRLDTQRRLLFAPGSDEPVALPSKALDTLVYLVEHRGEVIDKRAVMDAVWPRVVVEENSLDRNISLLRKALGEAPGDNRFIVTVPGRGYRFVARVVGGGEGPIPQPDSPPTHSNRRWLIVAMVAVLVGIGVVAYLRWPHPNPPPTVASNASVAVMPFANLTYDATLDYFGDGLAEELIHRLARVPGLKVPARTSSFAYKNRNIDVRQIGRDLAVTHVLEGSVRGDKNTIRVTAQLVDARTGYHVWSQTYDHIPGDIFKLQDQLAVSIAQTLTPGLHAGSTGATLAPTENVEAYQAYLQANALVGATEGNLQQAMNLYDQAIALDPKFARALSARASTRLTYLLLNLPVPGGVDAAERDARRAAELDPDFAGAHLALAGIHAARLRWIDAEQEYQLALAKGRYDPAILISRTTYLNSMGHQKEALRMAESAYDLAPLALPAIVNRAGGYSLAGRDDIALREVNLGISMGAATQYGIVPLVLSNAAWHAGRYDEAARYLLTTMSPGARPAGAERALTLAFESTRHPEKRPEAAAALRELTARVPMESLDRRRGMTLMLLSAMVGDLDAAFAAADRAMTDYEKNGTGGAAFAPLWVPSTRALREDPRFQQLVKRTGMMDYWKRYGPPDGCTLMDEQLLCAGTAQ